MTRELDKEACRKAFGEAWNNTVNTKSAPDDGMLLYQCIHCGGVYQSLVTECDCMVGAHFQYRLLRAYHGELREMERERRDEINQLVAQIKAALTNLVEKRNNDLFSHHFCAEGAKDRLDKLVVALTQEAKP